MLFLLLLMNNRILFLRINYNIPFLLEIFHTSTMEFDGSSLNDEFHDGFFWATSTLMTSFLASNCESHAFLSLQSLNHVVGWEVRIDTGDWLYYFCYFSCRTFYEHSDHGYLLYPWVVIFPFHVFYLLV